MAQYPLGRPKKGSAKGYGGSDKNGGRLRLQISSAGRSVEHGAERGRKFGPGPRRILISNRHAAEERGNGMGIKICKEERKARGKGRGE